MLISAQRIQNVCCELPFETRTIAPVQDVNWMKIKDLWIAEEKEWRLIQDWTMSDDLYGCEKPQNQQAQEDMKFPNFAMWKEEEMKRLSGDKGKGH